MAKQFITSFDRTKYYSLEVFAQGGWRRDLEQILNFIAKGPNSSGIILLLLKKYRGNSR